MISQRHIPTMFKKKKEIFNLGVYIKYSSQYYMPITTFQIRMHMVKYGCNTTSCDTLINSAFSLCHIFDKKQIKFAFNISLQAAVISLIQRQSHIWSDFGNIISFVFPMVLKCMLDWLFSFVVGIQKIGAVLCI